MNIEQIILSFGYLAIFIFMITNGIVSLPSSQFIYVTAGFFVPAGHFSLWAIVLVGTVGNTIGNIILYEIARKKGLEHIGKWKGFSKEKISALRKAFELRGWLIIFIGKFLPGVKVLVPAVAGLASMNRYSHCIIIAVSSFFWAWGLTYFGAYFGENYNKGTFGWYSAILIVLAMVAIWIFIRYIKKLTKEATTATE